MSTPAQINANRTNAQASTGPRTAEGLIAAARNAVTLGLYTINDFVRPGEQPEYERHCLPLWDELKATGPLQRTLGIEIVKASWRLHRCALIEASFEGDLDPMQNEANAKIQASVDRARAQSHNILRRSLAELRRLQSEAVPDPAAAPAPQAITNRTQSVPASTPRSASCPCGSGIKYKRCCGINAPAVLNIERRSAPGQSPALR